MSHVQHNIQISRPFISNNNPENAPRLRTRIAQAILRLRPIPLPPPPSKQPIQIVCISDTHNSKPTLPPGDILLHSGDLSQHGTFAEMQAQLDWMAAQQHQHKIVIAGNHDLLLDAAFVERHPDRELQTPGRSAHDLDWGDIVYLEDQAMDITCGSRRVKVFGSPHTPRCGSFAFQYGADDDVWKGRIPDGTDVVLTHGPPALHLDGGKGCRHLLRELWRVRPSLVVFGHIHHARGRETVALSRSQWAYEGVALGASPLVCMLLLLWYVLLERFRIDRSVDSILLVNAACDRGEDGVTVAL